YLHALLDMGTVSAAAADESDLYCFCHNILLFSVIALFSHSAAGRSVICGIVSVPFHVEKR
ncbi:MAG: hypothetical protein J6C42_04070, partial [Clostridia bacterium]|nr:hypothetical protein [Clostridia bacterium]